MKNYLQGVCPLCGQKFSRVHLYAHIIAERPPVRHDTFKEIQSRHPGWVYEHGACRGCWDSYRDSGITPASDHKRVPDRELDAQQL